MIYTIRKSIQGLTYLKYFHKNKSSLKNLLDIVSGNGQSIKLININTSLRR